MVRSHVVPMISANESSILDQFDSTFYLNYADDSVSDLACELVISLHLRRRSNVVSQ